MPNDEKNVEKTLTVGGFITPTNPVSNNKDNDGGGASWMVGIL